MRAAGVAAANSTWTVLTSNYTTDALTVAGVEGLCSSGAPRWPVLEASITSVHAAMLAGQLTCSQLVGAYVQAKLLLILLMIPRSTCAGSRKLFCVDVESLQQAIRTCALSLFALLLILLLAVTEDPGVRQGDGADSSACAGFRPAHHSSRDGRAAADGVHNAPPSADHGRPTAWPSQP
jgi:hypothetical protein